MAEQAELETNESTEQAEQQAEELQQEQLQPEAEEQQPETEEPEEPGSIHDDPLLSALYEDLGLISNPNKGKEEIEVEQVDEAEPEEPQQEPQPEVQAEDVEPVEKPKVNKTFQVKTPVTQTDVRAAVREEFEKYNKLPEPEPKNQPIAEPQRDTYEDGLLDEQREELALARYAETKLPDKYKGMGNRLVEFYKKLDNYAAKAQEDPDRTLDSNDEEFMDFIQNNKPELSLSESKKLERMMWKEEAVNEARKANEEDKRSLERKLHNLEARPRVENSLKEFESNLPNMIPDELGDSIREHGFDKAESENPYEISIIKEKLSSASGLAKEYLSISNGITDYDSNNSNHEWLLGFINNQAQYFQKNGGNELVRQDSVGNTAQFVTPTEYANLSKQGNTTGKWTFTPDDVLKMLGANAVKEAQDTIKSEEQRLTKMGFVRQKKTVAAEPKKKEKQSPETKPITPPKSKSSAGPGATNNAAIEDPVAVGADILDILKMK
jgi:hypothetical protein